MYVVAQDFAHRRHLTNADDEEDGYYGEADFPIPTPRKKKSLSEYSIGPKIEKRITEHKEPETAPLYIFKLGISHKLFCISRDCAGNGARPIRHKKWEIITKKKN